MKKIIAVFVFIMLTITTMINGGTIYAQSLEKQGEDPVLVISNITSISFTVSWFDYPKNSRGLLYGPTEAQFVSGPDDRGAGGNLESHHVTLYGLIPNTDYIFQLEGSEKKYHQRTPEMLKTIPWLPETFSGKVFTEDNIAPAEGIMYMVVGGSQLISAPIQTTGDWQLATYGIRNDTFNEYYQIQRYNMAFFFVKSGADGEAVNTRYMFGKDGSIDFHLQAPRIPFFKVQLPGSEKYLAQPVPDSSDAPAGSASTASQEGFFDIMWRRIKEIF